MSALIIACLFVAVTVGVIGVNYAMKGRFGLGWTLMTCAFGIVIIPFVIVIEAAQ